MQEVLNETTDEAVLKQRLEGLQQSREKYVYAKDRLFGQINRLDYTDPMYDVKVEDMERRLDNLYADIAQVDSEIEKVNRDLKDSKDAKATIEDAYYVLQCASTDMQTWDDAAKKEIVNAFIERVDIFSEMTNGRWVKSIDFQFPVVTSDGEDGSTSIPRKEAHVETIRVQRINRQADGVARLAERLRGGGDPSWEHPALFQAMIRPQSHPLQAFRPCGASRQKDARPLRPDVRCPDSEK